MAVTTTTKPDDLPQACSAGDAAALNSLLRGELSAVETYEQAISKFEGTDYAVVMKELRRIRDEHAAAVATLTARVTAIGAEPSKGSGVWGVFATAVTGVAKVMGPHTALGALRRGEEHGVAEYEGVVNKDDVSVECKYLIRNELLTRCKDHIDALDRLVQELKLEGK